MRASGIYVTAPAESREQRRVWSKKKKKHRNFSESIMVLPGENKGLYKGLSSLPAKVVSSSIHKDCIYCPIDDLAVTVINTIDY